MLDENRPHPLADGVHHALLAILLLTRPLIWDGQPGEPAALAWYVLVSIGLLVLAVEYGIGLRRTWRWSAVSVVATLAVLLLIPAGLRSPQGFTGLSDLGQLLGHLAFAAYCSQAIIGRERAAIAALLSGLGLELTYALGQQFLANAELQKQLAKGTVKGVSPHLFADMAQRVREGGIYGTFTLSNALAAFLLLTVPVAIAVAASRQGIVARVVAAVLGLAGLAVLIITFSKGAWAAAIVAIGFIAARRLTRWPRVVIPGAIALGIAVVLLVPNLRARFSASAEVRLGYWNAAGELIGERPLAGHGIGAYASESPRVIAVGAEYSRQVHNEVLEAAVAGGLFAGIAVAIWFILLVARRRSPILDGEPAPLWIPATAFAVIYLHIFGMLPAGGFIEDSGDLHLGFACGFALLAAALLAALRQVTLPGWALELGLTAAVIHALQDFDLRSGGVLGVLIALACLGGGGRRFGTGPLFGLLPGLGGLLLIGTLCWSLPRSTALSDAENIVGHITTLDRSKGTGPQMETAVQALHFMLDRPEPGAAEHSRPALVSLRAAAIDHAWERAEFANAPAETRISILVLLRPGKERLPRTTAVVERFPSSALAHALMAEDFAAAEQWHLALTAIRQSVQRAPWRLVYRQRLVDMLERCAATTGDPALLQEAEAERQRIATLQDQVYFRDRLPDPPPRSR